MIDYSPAELCMLLLCALPSDVPPISAASFQRLAEAMIVCDRDLFGEDVQLTERELKTMGCSEDECEIILRRLDSGTDCLRDWLHSAQQQGVQVIPRNSPYYPVRMRQALGSAAPLVLYCAGDTALLNMASVSLVGSRNLNPTGLAFASEAGKQIAAQQYVYCSGGARGADTVGLEHAVPPGKAVLFLSDSLLQQSRSRRYRETVKNGSVLLISENGIDSSFTAARALARNRLIHAFSDITLIAQTGFGRGGTWKGTLENLKHNWSVPFVCTDHNEDPGVCALLEKGCSPVTMQELQMLGSLQPIQTSFC